VFFAWTDACKNETGEVGFAVWFGEGDQYNYQQRMPRGTLVFTAELTAAIHAILLHDPRLPLEVCSDNEPVVTLLNAEKWDLGRR
jgi:hypothetical protein